jgi:hypothetical protein
MVSTEVEDSEVFLIPVFQVLHGRVIESCDEMLRRSMRLDLIA